MLRPPAETITARLILAIGSRAGLEAPLQLGYYMIGRSQECQIRPKSRSVSREHCLIHNRQGGLRIIDLSSSAGTFVNGARLQPRSWEPLPHGAQLRCGKVLFQVSIDQVPPRFSGEQTEKEVAVSAGSTGTMLTGGAWHDVDVASFLDAQDVADRELRYGNVRARSGGAPNGNAEAGRGDDDEDAAEFETSVDLDLFNEDFDDGAVYAPTYDSESNLSGPVAASAEGKPKSEGARTKQKPKQPSRSMPSRSKTKNPRAARAGVSWDYWGSRDKIKLIGAVAILFTVLGFCGYSCYKFYTGPEVRVLQDID